MIKVTVYRNKQIETEINFVNTDSTLLGALQKNGVEVLYHCKEGFCGACRCKLKSGSISYINEPLAFVRKGEILTCSSVPNGDIEIELL